MNFQCSFAANRVTIVNLWSVAARGPGIAYQIFNPDDSLLLDQTPARREYRGQLWQSGDHVIAVINRGNAATSYNVIFAVN